MSITEVLDSNLEEMRECISGIRLIVDGLNEEMSSLKSQINIISEKQEKNVGDLLFGLPPRAVLKMNDRRLFDRSVNPHSPFVSYPSMYYAKKAKHCPFTTHDEGKDFVIIIQDLYDWFMSGKTVGHKSSSSSRSRKSYS